MAVNRPEDKYAKVGEINMRFWSMGDRGPILILLHGIGCHVEMWEKNIAALSQDHHVYAIDIMGFGRSDKPPAPYSPQLLVRFVLDFMETLHIEKATLIGNSMGGGISMMIAIQSPERVDKLVLVDTIGLGKEVSPVLRLMSLPLIGELLTRPGRKGVLRTMKLCLYDPSAVTDDFIERAAQIAVLPRAQNAFLATLRSGGAFGGIKKELLSAYFDNFHRIKAPSLVIWGRQDRIFPVAHAQVALEKIPGAKLHIIDRAGHFPQMDQPEEFNAAVLEFLRA